MDYTCWLALVFKAKEPKTIPFFLLGDRSRTPFSIFVLAIWAEHNNCSLEMWFPLTILFCTMVRASYLHELTSVSCKLGAHFQASIDTLDLRSTSFTFFDKMYPIRNETENETGVLICISVHSMSVSRSLKWACKSYRTNMPGFCHPLYSFTCSGFVLVEDLSLRLLQESVTTVLSTCNRPTCNKTST